MRNDQNTHNAQHQDTLMWDPYIGSHINVSWCCAIVVHKECRDHSPIVITTRKPNLNK
jgi:hypothetical protein